MADRHGEFESTPWSSLSHAYGSADDTPRLLARLQQGDKQALSSLFGSICHQGSVYSASFAAAPYLVRIANNEADPTFRASVLILVGSIHSSTDDRSGGVSSDIMDAYRLALPQALSAAVSTLGQGLDSVTATYLLEATAALNGLTSPGRVISGFVAREFRLCCPGCKRELYVWPEAGQLAVSAEDPVSHPETKRALTQPAPSLAPAAADELSWLCQLAQAAGLVEVQTLLPHLYGDAACPECATSFNVMECLGQEDA